MSNIPQIQNKNRGTLRASSEDLLNKAWLSDNNVSKVGDLMRCLGENNIDKKMRDSIKYQKNLCLLKDRLNSLGLCKKEIGGDGNCYFLSLVDQLNRLGIHPEGYDFTFGSVSGVNYQYPEASRKCRFDVVLHMARNANDFRCGYNRREFIGYLQKMRKSRCWAGGQEISASADLFNVVIECFIVSVGGLNVEIYRPRRQEEESEECWLERCSKLPILRICLHGNHFWSTQSEEEKEAICKLEEERLEKELKDLQISDEEIDNDDDDDDDEVDEEIDEESDDEEEVVCNILKYEGKEYLIGVSPDSEKNKIFNIKEPNDYLGRLIINGNLKSIDFSIPED